MSPKAGVVIVGGGVIGCSIAYHLGKQGVPSQIIEMDAIAAKASGKAWAVISSPEQAVVLYEGTEVPKKSMRPCLSFYEEGLRRFPQLALELKEEGGVDIGHGELPVIRLVFQESEERYLKERMSEVKGEGFKVGWLDETDIKARFPDVTPEVRGGVFFPGQQVEPYRYVLALFQAAEAKGASMKQGEVVGFRSQGSRVIAVTLTTRELEADIVVLAMGPWIRQGSSWLGKGLPISVKRSQCLKVKPPQRLPPYRFQSSQVTIIPKVDGTVVLGLPVVDEEVDFDDTPTEEAKIRLIQAAVGVFPKLEESRLIEHRAGLEGCQPNGGLPMLGRFPGWDNVYLATWLGPFGIQWSPAVGRRMAELIVKGHTEEPMEPLSPARLITTENKGDDVFLP